MRQAVLEVLSLAAIKLTSVDVDMIFQELRVSTGLFQVWKVSGDDISTQCPFHGGGREQNPSFGICNNKMNPHYGKYHCFTCGATGTILSLINELYNRPANDLFAIEYAQSFSDLEVVDEHQKIEVRTRKTLDSFISVSQDEVDYYTNQECDYLSKRKIKPVIQQAFDCGYDPITQSVTFPVKRLDGSVDFIVRRAVNLKWYNYPPGITKPVYGMYELTKLAPRTQSVVICESIINALTLWGEGIPAVALLGTGSRKQIEYLNTLDIRNYILALDGDTAGQVATEKLKQRLQARTTVMPIPPGYDVNDLDTYSINILYSLRR